MGRRSFNIIFSHFFILLLLAHASTASTSKGVVRLVFDRRDRGSNSSGMRRECAEHSHGGIQDRKRQLLL